jgi:hypothetical protein
VLKRKKLLQFSLTFILKKEEIKYNNYMNAQTVIEKLKSLPTDIYNLQIEILEKTVNLNDLSRKIIKAESVIRVNISEMKDESGKKKYSNEEARRAAFSELVELDIELIEWKKEMDALENQIQLQKAEFDQLVNEQKNFRSILNFLSNSNIQNI